MSIEKLREALAHSKKIAQGQHILIATQVEVEVALAQHDWLLEDLNTMKRFAYEEAPRIAVEQANKQTADLRAEVERLRSELGYIANAKHGNIECEFRAWAKNRARHALGEKPGELTIKK